MDTEIKVSTENLLRRKFSRRSCRDSNPRPISHESGALTTELFPLPNYQYSPNIKHKVTNIDYMDEKTNGDKNIL